MREQIIAVLCTATLVAALFAESAPAAAIAALILGGAPWREAHREARDLLLRARDVADGWRNTAEALYDHHQR